MSEPDDIFGGHCSEGLNWPKEESAFDALERLVAQLGKPPPPAPAQLLMNAATIARMKAEADPELSPVAMLPGLRIVEHPMMGDGQWAVLDTEGRLIMVNGTPVDPGPTLAELLIPGWPW